MDMDKPYRLMIRTTDENGVPAWIMSDNEYATPPEAFDDMLKDEGASIVVKLCPPVDRGSVKDA
jgi:hypothetical protein